LSSAHFHEKSTQQKDDPLAIGFEQHDHAGCITSSLEGAEQTCKSRGVQLTPARRRVLEILLQEHRAMRAYDILDILRSEGLGSQPPIAYRALDFLVQQGFAHKIVRLNAFIACAHPGEKHDPEFLICRKCDAVAETQSQASAGSLGTSARAAGFEIECAVIEAEGICPNCKDPAPL
jgi:Fur family zinc uptake transcriptional regulator